MHSNLPFYYAECTFTDFLYKGGDPKCCRVIATRTKFCYPDTGFDLGADGYQYRFMLDNFDDESTIILGHNIDISRLIQITELTYEQAKELLSEWMVNTL